MNIRLKRIFSESLKKNNFSIYLSFSYILMKFNQFRFRTYCHSHTIFSSRFCWKKIQWLPLPENMVNMLRIRLKRKRWNTSIFLMFMNLKINWKEIDEQNVSTALKRNILYFLSFHFLFCFCIQQTNKHIVRSISWSWFWFFGFSQALRFAINSLQSNIMQSNCSFICCIYCIGYEIDECRAFSFNDNWADGSAYLKHSSTCFSIFFHSISFRFIFCSIFLF